MGQRAKRNKDRSKVKGYAIKTQNISNKSGGQTSNKPSSSSNRRKKKKKR